MMSNRMFSISTTALNFCRMRRLSRSQYVLMSLTWEGEELSSRAGQSFNRSSSNPFLWPLMSKRMHLSLGSFPASCSRRDSSQSITLP